MTTMIPTFQRQFHDEIMPKLKERFSYSSVMAVPRISKITLNMGVGEAALDKKHMTSAVSDLTKISGQKPIVTSSKKAVASFKIRENWPIGCKVTMRRKRMYDFLERLILISIPRIRDFRGFKASFDGRGNLSIGIREQSVFPEISFDEVDSTRGLDITITTTAQTDAEGKALLLAFGFPFREK